MNMLLLLWKYKSNEIQQARKFLTFLIGKSIARTGHNLRHAKDKPCRCDAVNDTMQRKNVQITGTHLAECGEII